MKTERFDKKLFKQEVLNNLKTQFRVELANVPIHFGSTVEGTGMIGNDNSRLSFYYQPTYFNVRGSVYDTTH